MHTTLQFLLSDTLKNVLHQNKSHKKSEATNTVGRGQSRKAVPVASPAAYLLASVLLAAAVWDLLTTKIKAMK